MSSLDAVRRHLEARDEILFAYLFGSRAGGRPRPDSDWDVAIF
ncbi:MAG: nucleotidyltransferase domain-containing protein, partial [bacterium]|nr:nucleotidyltransferase domain-containing protein [bacterium]